jgi:hypothetical protein
VSPRRQSSPKLDGPNCGGARPLPRRNHRLRKPGGGRCLSRPDRKNHRALPARGNGRRAATGGCRLWGQPVVIENRTGAAGNIGAEQAYRSAPDAYTLLSSPPPPLVINQNLYRNLSFHPLKFEPVIVSAMVPNALIVNPNNVKASNVSELIEYLKNNPDKVTSATQGNGTTSHLTSKLFQLMAKVKLRHIPYRGSAPERGSAPARVERSFREATCRDFRGLNRDDFKIHAR